MNWYVTRSLGPLVVAAVLAVSSCASVQLFPEEATRGIDRRFDFAAWRNSPGAYPDRRVELGGRIVHAEQNGDDIAILTSQLPIVEHPVYGPQDSGKRTGEFVILFAGKMSPQWLQSGNRVIVVGTTQASKVSSGGDSPRQAPAVRATCLHLWNTGGREISEFPSFGGGYEPLEEITACAAHP